MLVHWVYFLRQCGMYVCTPLGNTESARLVYLVDRVGSKHSYRVFSRRRDYMGTEKTVTMAGAIDPPPNSK